MRPNKASKNPFNVLARTAISFKRACRKIYVGSWDWSRERMFEYLHSQHKIVDSPYSYKYAFGDLSSILKSLPSIRIEDDWVLDGYPTTITYDKGDGFKLNLYARKNENVNLVEIRERGHDYDIREFIKQCEALTEHTVLRNVVNKRHEDYFKVGLWNCLHVPFTEKGIWQAVLLYFAPRCLISKGYCSEDKFDFEIICSDSNLSKYNKDSKLIGSKRLYPKVHIKEKAASVSFVSWENRGLVRYSVRVAKDGNSVSIKSVENRIIEEYVPYNDILTIPYQFLNKTIGVPLNCLAEVGSRFKESCNKESLNTMSFHELVSSVFNFLKIEDGYVLDIFKVEAQNFGFFYKLYTYKSDSECFTPPDWQRFSIHLPEEEKKERIEKLDGYSPKQRVAATVHIDEYKRLKTELWEHLVVPFTKEGIWEAALLYMAEHMLPLGWHCNCEKIELICSDGDLEKFERKSKYIGSNKIKPKVKITGDRALVDYASWEGSNLYLHHLTVLRKENSVSISDDSYEILTQHFSDIMM